MRPPKVLIVMMVILMITGIEVDGGLFGGNGQTENKKVAQKTLDNVFLPKVTWFVGMDKRTRNVYYLSSPTVTKHSKGNLFTVTAYVKADKLQKDKISISYSKTFYCIATVRKTRNLWGRMTVKVDDQHSYYCN